jgi:hypothetical protein
MRWGDFFGVSDLAKLGSFEAASTGRLAPCRFCLLISVAARGEVDAVFC